MHRHTIHNFEPFPYFTKFVRTKLILQPKDSQYRRTPLSLDLGEMFSIYFHGQKAMEFFCRYGGSADENHLGKGGEQISALGTEWLHTEYSINDFYYSNFLLDQWLMF